MLERVTPSFRAVVFRDVQDDRSRAKLVADVDS